MLPVSRQRLPGTAHQQALPLDKTRPAPPFHRHFRENVRPARHKPLVLGHFSCAGRTFSRSRPPSDRARRKMPHTGHGNTSVLKEKSPLHEVLGAVVKHFSPMRVHKSHFWPISTEQGRCFFHCGCMPGTGAIRWGDISFRVRPRPPTEPPILTRRTRQQRPSPTGVEGAGGTGGYGRASRRGAERSEAA